MISYVNIILSITLISLIIVFYHQNKRGWMLGLICAYLCCQLDITVMNMTFNSHYLLLPVLLTFALLEWRKGSIYITRPTLYFIVAWVSTLCIYFVAYMINGDKSVWIQAGVKFIGISAYILEATLLIVLFQTLEEDQKLKSFLYFLIVVAAVNTLLIVMQTYVDYVGTTVTRQLVSGHILEHDISDGIFKRAHGIFVSPVILAGVSVLTLAVFAGYAIRKANIHWRYYVVAIVVGAAGLFSYTKTAVLGYPVVLIVASFCLFFNKKQSVGWRLKRIGIFALCTLMMFSVWYVATPPQNVYRRDVYLGYMVKNMDDTFDTRVRDLVEDKEDVITEEGSVEDIKSSLSIFKENPLIGVGPMPAEGEQIYDMMYISILHNGGALAFVILMAFYCGLAIYAFIKRRFISLLILAVMALICFASDVLTYTAIMPFFVLALNLVEDEKGKKLYLKSPRKYNVEQH